MATIKAFSARLDFWRRLFDPPDVLEIEPESCFSRSVPRPASERNTPTAIVALPSQVPWWFCRTIESASVKGTHLDRDSYQH